MKAAAALVSTSSEGEAELHEVAEAEPPETPAKEVSAPPPTSFDAARASAFRSAPSDGAVGDAKIEPESEPKVAFRIAEDPDVVRVRAGGPVVELEASLIRELEPVPAPEAVAEGEPEPERPTESPAWRRTAMAELTALAADSDDLTPNRRR